jgi:outer membrane protein assembly factor BamB
MKRALLLVTLLITNGVLGADNWERFRGPNGTGTVDDKDVPLTFSATENVVWQTPLAGAGNSSPIIWENRLFLHSASKDGKTRTLHCFDTASGKILWEKSIPGAHVKIRADSSFASSTPTTDGRAVYVSFWDGKDILLTAYDFQGEKLWQKNLGEFNSQHGAGASPIVHKDKLILANDMDKDDFTTKKTNPRPSFVMAFDKRTGDLLWETARSSERTCYSLPLLLQKPGRTEPELVITNTMAITGYNLESGSKLWEAKNWQDKLAKGLMRTVATPALVGNVLCVCCGGDAGRLAIGLDLSAADKTEVPERLWDNHKDFPYVPSLLSRGDHVYFVNDAGYAGCYEAKTGKRVWFERLPGASFHSSPLMVSGNVYAASTTGDVFVFPAETKYRLLARNELGETIRATAAVAGGRLYIRGERNLYCIGKASGRK